MIRVFDSTDKTYETNGNVVLQPTYSNIHKEDNGEYYLDIETNLQNEVIKHIESEEGTNVDLTYSTKLTDVDATKQHEFTKMYGDTQQDSTTGKNLYAPYSHTRTASSFTITTNLDGTITANGTASSSFASIANADAQSHLFTLQAGTYTLSGGYSNDLFLQICNSSGTGLASSKTSASTFTLSETTQVYLRAYVNNGASVSNIKMYPMLETGSSPTSYEPYTNGASPNPDYPQEIHNVSGDNEIKVCNKNLLKLDVFNVNNQKTFTANGVTATLNDDETITLNGTASSNTDFYIKNNNVESTNKKVVFFAIDGRFTGKTGMYCYTAGNQDGKSVNLEEIGKGEVNLVKNKTYTLFEIYARNGNVYNNARFGIMAVDKDLTINTYEPHKEYTKEINLPVENLFDKDNANVINASISSTSVTSSANAKSIYIPITGGQTYTISKRLSARFRVATTIDTPAVGVSTSDFHQEDTLTSYTIQTSSTAKYLVFYYFLNRTDTLTEQEILDSIQIEKGSKANSYSEYGKPYIELNKISTYQDYIYKDNDRWYLHKEIGKVVLNGSEVWATKNNQVGTSSFYRYSCNDFQDTTKYMANTLYISDNFTYATNTLQEKNVIGNTTTADLNRLYITIDTTLVGGTTTSDFKTWLSTHNTIVYYVLATPTDTEITDTTLLEQLENLNKMTLYEGINNISILPNDLVPTLKLHYNYVEGGDLTTGDYLKPNNIIVSNTPTGNQAFRITNIDKRTHKIKIKANHVFFDSLNYVIQDSYVVDKNCNDALDHLNNATDNISPFTTTSDINTINSYRCVRKSLYEAINVVLERWGGHLVRDNFDIKVMNTIGQDNGVVVRYAKNLKDIEVDYNWDEVCTKILPVGNDGLMLDEISLYGDIQYDIPYTKVVHFSQDIDETPYEDENGNLDQNAYTEALKADLRRQAQDYLQKNQIPQVNYTLQANLEKITDVGDIIQVIDERLGVNITTSLISYDYDPTLDRYTSLEFGNFKKELSSLTEIIGTQTTEIVNQATTTTKITLENELNEATSKIWGMLGNSYVIVEGDKILILDSLPKESATNVIMLNSAGIGFSNTGINGTFTSAWTIDNVLNMQNINVINLTADLIKGGTLKLGSNLNQNGKLEVYDDANNLIAELNKNGLKMYATDGGYILINTTVGFAGYDRNNVKIYWADGDEFHMKKSVVEEEITLVDKMRIIPITITNNGTITNDGIGFVSTL